MPTLIDASPSTTETPPAGPKKRIPPQLEPYLFKKGQPVPRGGRPKGSRSASTIYLESLPLKAKQWVKSTHAGVLIDARKIALPIESDQQSPTLALTRVEIVAELQRRGIAIPAEIPT